MDSKKDPRQVEVAGQQGHDFDNTLADHSYCRPKAKEVRTFSAVANSILGMS